MNEQTHVNIPFPIHPEDKQLPRSNINVQLPSGKIVGMYGLPIQGGRTIQNLIDILNIWKPTIVVDHRITFYNPGFAAWQQGKLGLSPKG